MQTRIPGFRGEYLWELDVPQIHLLALADAIPEVTYGWRPADDARSLSEVLVHVAAGNFLLLTLSGMRAPGGLDLYGHLDNGNPLQRIAAMVRKNSLLEKTVTEKTAVVELLRKSLEAVRLSFLSASDEDIERTGNFFGEPTTVRRVYLRMLAHTHEHMGQAIAYARSNGVRVPWADPLEELERLAAG
jgi:hypothetical protein